MWNISAGSGQPVVLVHGAFCDYRFWESQLEAISQRYRTIAVSLSGYHPESFEEADKFSAELHVNEVGAFLADLGSKAHLIGHSRGGRVALHVAAKFPGLLKSLVLLEPGGLMEAGFLSAEASEKPRVSNNVMEEAEALIKSGEIERGMRLYIDSGHGGGTWQRLPPEICRVVLSNAQTICGMMMDRSAPFTRDAAMSVQCPTLLVSGNESPSIFGQIVQVLGTLISNSTCKSLSGADHFFPNNERELINNMILDWLDQNTVPGETPARVATN